MGTIFFSYNNFISASQTSERKKSKHSVTLEEGEFHFVWYPGCKARPSKSTPNQRWNMLIRRISSYKSDMESVIHEADRMEGEGDMYGYII